MKPNVYFCCHLLTIVSFQNQWSRMFIFVVTWQLFLFRINEAECLFLLSPDNCFFSESMKLNVYFCCHLTIVSFQNQWSRMFIFIVTWQLFLFRINETQCLFLLSPDNCFFSESMKLNVYFCCHLTIVSFQNQWSRMFIFVVTWQLFLFRINEAECLFLLSPPDNCFFSESMKPNVYFCCHLTIVSFQNQWSWMFIFVVTSWQLFLFRINEAECLFLLSPPDNCFFSESMKPNVYFCCHLTIVSFQN